MPYLAYIYPICITRYHTKYHTKLAGPVASGTRLIHTLLFKKEAGISCLKMYQFGVERRCSPTLIPSFLTYAFTTTIFLCCCPLTLVLVFAIALAPFI